MPKGVMWRHEDVFFACYGGGNYFDPIDTPEQIADNGIEPPAAIDPLALAPLMHGGGQWITFIGVYSGGKSTIYTERRFDAHEVLRLIDREQPMTVAFVGDAMARPVAEAVLDPTTSYDLSSIVSVGNGGAMLTKAVRAQIQAAFPYAVITDSYGATETGAAGTQVEQEGYTEGPKFTVNEQTTVLGDDLRPVEPGARGMLACSGHILLGYYKDPEKTAATFRTDADGRRWVIPGDFATSTSRAALSCSAGGRSPSTPAARRSSPRRSSRRCGPTPRCTTRWCVACPTRWGSGWWPGRAARGRGLIPPRGSTGPLPSARRRLQAPPGRRPRPSRAHQRRQARLRLGPPARFRRPSRPDLNPSEISPRQAPSEDLACLVPRSSSKKTTDFDLVVGQFSRTWERSSASSGDAPSW